MTTFVRSFSIVFCALTLASCGLANKNSNLIDEHSKPNEIDENSLGLSAPTSIHPGFQYEGVAFTMAVNGKPVYRLFHTVSGNHLYTMNVDEVRAASRGGYRFEGIAFYSQPSVNSVHRLYNPSTGQHFYSASVPEVTHLKERLGYRYEGIAFTARCIGSCETGNSVNVHRFKKPLGHFWSTSGN